MLVGVDIGGTFTDLVVSDGGQLRVHKLLSTPGDPSQAMLAGLRALSPDGLGAFERIAHGSTVATNAILERKGAKAALITTAGFRDLLAIGRQNRPDLYALQPTLPPALIPRERCFEAVERLDYTGAVLMPLDPAALDAMLDQVVASGIEAVAVCLLYSYVNSTHERAIRDRIVERGIVPADAVILSSDVLPEFREYERASTAVLEAYVRPVMSRYLSRLEAALPAGAPLRVMKSDGGIVGVRQARAQAIQTALSGPAAGVMGAFHVARLAGYDQILTLDIGGTSTDVALCPGAPIRRPESEIDGLPLRIRLLDIETVGAGGGSIARLDTGGALRVGPESAGAAPGPILYGRGGQQITVSDANALLGRLDAEHFLGGQMTLDLDAARAAFDRLAVDLRLTPEAAALGVIEVANANIDRALRRVSIARGHDPRDFTLVAFGGAGPLHACAVAQRLQIPRVLVPRTPGVLCAFGLLVADVALDSSRSMLGPLDAETSSLLSRHLSEMTTQARADLQVEGIADAEMTFAATVDMRYRGQAYELVVPYAPGVDLAAAYHSAHERAYGYALRSRVIEVVNLRLQAIGAVEKPILIQEPEGGEDASSARIGVKDRPGERLTLYDREALSPGMRFDGGALAFQLDSTVYVAPGWSARVDGWRNLILEHS